MNSLTMFGGHVFCQKITLLPEALKPNATVWLDCHAKCICPGIQSITVLLQLF